MTDETYEAFKRSPEYSAMVAEIKARGSAEFAEGQQIAEERAKSERLRRAREDMVRNIERSGSAIERMWLRAGQQRNRGL